MAARVVTDVSEFKQLLARAQSEQALCIVDFWADWCEPCHHMNNVFQQLAKSYLKHSFLQVEAEKADDIAMQFDIASVPTFIFIKDGKEIDRLVGADALMLAKKIENYTTIAERAAPVQTEELSTSPLKQRLIKLVNYAPIMLFMKGTPDTPQCGFSSKIVEILKKNKIPFSAFNILSDQEVREGLKNFSNWKTYPQLYVNGELIGGLDIVKELDEEGELLDTVKPALDIADPKAALNEKLTRLINSAPVMIFIKGTPDEPKCGFSTQLLSILNDRNVKYASFNILSDPSVREGLKEFSNWPTYPQLYVKGKLVGGLDIVKELVENNEFSDAIESV